MRVFYAHTAGHMESLALPVFLRKLDPRLTEPGRLIPVCPAKYVPGPRPLRSDLTPAERKMHPLSGLTGKALIDQITSRLSEPYFRGSEYADVVALLIVDDADCRFCPGAPFAKDCGTKQEALDKWCKDIADAVADALGRPLPIIPMLASPEGEAWLYADWAEGFGKQYPTLAHDLKKRIDGEILRGVTIEDWGAWSATSKSCATKFSDEIMKLDASLADFRYSKANDGAEMLRRVRPSAIANVCTTFFGPAYQSVRRLP